MQGSVKPWHLYLFRHLEPSSLQHEAPLTHDTPVRLDRSLADICPSYDGSLLNCIVGRAGIQLFVAGRT